MIDRRCGESAWWQFDWQVVTENRCQPQESVNAA